MMFSVGRQVAATLIARQRDENREGRGPAPALMLKKPVPVWNILPYFSTPVKQKDFSNKGLTFSKNVVNWSTPNLH